MMPGAWSQARHHRERPAQDRTALQVSARVAGNSNGCAGRGEAEAERRPAL